MRPGRFLDNYVRDTFASLPTKQILGQELGPKTFVPDTAETTSRGQRSAAYLLRRALADQPTTTTTTTVEYTIRNIVVTGEDEDADEVTDAEIEAEYEEFADRLVVVTSSEDFVETLKEEEKEEEEQEADVFSSLSNVEVEAQDYEEQEHEQQQSDSDVDVESSSISPSTSKLMLISTQTSTSTPTLTSTSTSTWNFLILLGHRPQQRKQHPVQPMSVRILNSIKTPNDRAKSADPGIGRWGSTDPDLPIRIA